MKNYIKSILTLVISVFILMTATYAYTITIRERDMTVRYSKTSGKKVFLTSNVGENITGWRVVSGNITIENNSFIMPKEDVVIEPIYKTFTVSYDANGGEDAPEAQTKTYKVDLTLSSNTPTRSNYTFLGWATSSTATEAEYQAGGSFTMDANTTLYAVWRINSYTVTTTVNLADGGIVSGGGSKLYNSTVTLTATENTGYYFLNWEVISGGVTLSSTTNTTTTFIMPANNVEVKANFALREKQAIVIYDNNSKLQINKMAGEEFGITTTLASGETFGGWLARGITLSNPMQVSQAITIPNNPIGLYASKRQSGQGQKIRVEVNGKLISEIEKTTGESVTITATVNANQTFSKWEAYGVTLADETSETITITMPSTDVYLRIIAE